MVETRDNVWTVTPPAPPPPPQKKMAVVERWPLTEVPLQSFERCLVVSFQVIPVVVGEEADPDELKSTTTDKKNLIEADREESPSDVGEKIIEKIRGNCH